MKPGIIALDFLTQGGSHRVFSHFVYLILWLKRCQLGKDLFDGHLLFSQSCGGVVIHITLATGVTNVGREGGVEGG